VSNTTGKFKIIPWENSREEAIAIFFRHYLGVSPGELKKIIAGNQLLPDCKSGTLSRWDWFYKLSGDSVSAAILCKDESGTRMHTRAVASREHFKALPLERRTNRTAGSRLRLYIGAPRMHAWPVITELTLQIPRWRIWLNRKIRELSLTVHPSIGLAGLGKSMDGHIVLQQAKRVINGKVTIPLSYRKN
jgi:hypothetical protein